jgi:23S rRNA A2030 N6-methylase RlmJ
VAANPLPADLERFVRKIQEIRREAAVRKFQSDSMVVQVARDIERERLAMMRLREQYEGGCDAGE